jgi:predicted RNA-binding protein YlxR (DUF448 family)
VATKRQPPTRSCVICRSRRDKSDLLRIVRTPDGRVEFDETGKANGRGAYVCADESHWGDRGAFGKIRHSLQVQIDNSRFEALSNEVLSHLQTNQ